MKRQLTIFLLFLGFFSGIAYALILHSHHETAPLSRFIMWCPGFAAIVTCLVMKIPLGSLGWRWPARPFLVLAYFLPLLYAAPVYAITWLSIHGSFSAKPYESMMASQFGLSNWPILGTLGIALPQLFTITVIGTVVWTLGEELGWRGFLFPRLQQQFGFHGACLSSGTLWAVWHYPGLLGADYNSGTNPVFATICFTVMVIAMAYVMGYLRMRSGSVWPCVLLHATHNTFVQGLFDPLTTTVGWAKYVTSEFGVGMAAAMVVTATMVITLDRRQLKISI